MIPENRERCTELPPERGTKTKIPSLDGIRALSVSLVLFGHLCGTRHFLAERWADVFGDLANFGVRTFFVLSGFLITSLLRAERARTGTVSLRAFYARRLLRILPPFYAYLAVTALASACGILVLRPDDAIYAALFLTNYQFAPSWSIAHAWSLAVEEQFYLLWPPLLRIFALRSAQRFLVLALFAAPCVRLGAWIFFPGARWMIGKAFFSNYDAMAAGCLFALLQRSERAHGWRVGLAAACALAAHAAGGYLHGWMGHVRETLVNVALAFALEGATRLPVRSWAARILNHRTVSWIGTLSYSLYLWQEPFLDRNSSAWYAAFPCNILLAFAMAWGSYVLLERPLLKIRARLRS